MTSPLVDVLIVGAGPTGLTMALELALHNVPFRIIEKTTTPSDKSRALILHPRSLELLRRHGITKSIVERGITGTGARIYVNRKKAVDIDLEDLGFDHTAFPQPVWISQAETEAILTSHLRSAYNMKVERGVTAERLEQDASGVDVTLSKDENTERLRCAYVIGCDGAHSAVRHAAGLSFEGAPYPQDFVLCDAHLKWDQLGNEARHIALFLGSTGVMVLFPMKDGTVRLIGSRPADIMGDRDADSDPTLEDFQKLFSRMAPGNGELHDPVWLARFRLHHRGVDNYRKGRLFVAGDAAHIHSPAGGQGMNTGIQDAVNLGWKIARLLSREQGGGEVGERLLDSYNEERHRVGEYLLKGTDRLFGYASSTNPFWVSWRNLFVSWVLPWVFSSRERRGRMFRFVSELGIRYRRSSVVGTSEGFTGPVKGGDRAPDGKIKTPEGEEKFLLEMCRGNRLNLIIFSGSGTQVATPEDLKSTAARFTEFLATKNLGEMEVHKIYSSDPGNESGLLDLEGKLHKVYGFDKPGYVLVRPDAYVAYIGLQLSMDGLLDWLDDHY